MLSKDSFGKVGVDAKSKETNDGLTRYVSDPIILEQVNREFERAEKLYRDIGVDVNKALEQLSKIEISLHCWQADDVRGFENPEIGLSGGIQATGNYPGRARNITELRQDYELALSLVPGHHRVNLHAIYGDFGGKKVERNSIDYSHFESWVEWGRSKNIKIDFNATLFSHPKAEDGFTLSHKDKEIREYWIEHVKQCRKIAAEIGKNLGSPSVHNLWIPDGAKDFWIRKAYHRQLLKESLDEIFSINYSRDYLKDAIEGKLFGIGSESYVVGSHEFYYGYATTHSLLLTLDLGHYHPTESVADKISSVLLYLPEILLHISRGVRWDSDHVVIQNDEVTSLMQEIVRGNFLDSVNFALDYFDASINRIGAWVIGMRSTLRSLLYALLEPIELLQEYEEEGKNFQKLAVLEELKSYPWESVWNYYCLKNNVPIGLEWINVIEKYESEVLRGRT